MGTASPRLLAVQLLERVLDEAGGVDGLDLVGDPAALAADPSAADVEDLHGGLQLVLGDGDQVGVGGVGEHDRALLHGPVEFEVGEIGAWKLEARGVVGVLDVH